MQEIDTLPAGEFKAKCLKLMDIVNATKRSVTITKHGKPVARLVPANEEKPKKRLFGVLSDSLVLSEENENSFNPFMKR